MERPGPSVAQIRSALENNPHARTVGELVSFSFNKYTGLGARTDFYVEPLNLHVFGELTDFQIAGLNGAADAKRQPSGELTVIPNQFADLYNGILRDSMVSLYHFPHITRPFEFISNLASARVNLGSWQLNATDEVGTIKTTIERSFRNPELQAQAAKLGSPDKEDRTAHMGMVDVHVRLFPTGMGRLMHAYETGYYQDGNVVQWDQDEHNNLVYKGRYIRMDELSPEQLQALARGEFPFPAIEYLDKSEFKVDPEKKGDLERVQELLRTRLGRRNSEISDMFRPSMVPSVAAS